MSTTPWPYITAGNHDNETLLFLHGFMGSGRDWLPIAHHLEKDYYCVMPDLPGHGKNLNLAMDEPLGYNSLAAGLLSLAEKINIDKVSLIGYSMGGRLALFFAIQYAEKVQHLILESAHPGIIDEQARRKRAQIDEQRANQIRHFGIKAFVDSWYKMDFFRSMQQRSDEFAAMKIAREKNSPLWMAKVIHELSPGLQPALWDQLPKVMMDVLLIAGAQDSKYANTLKKAAQKLPQATINVIPNAGHNTHFEATKTFSKQIADFLYYQTLKNADLP